MSVVAPAIATKVATKVDARGQSCPGPIVSLFQAMKGARSGDVFELLASDPGSKTDIPSWARISGNELIEAEDLGAEFRYLVRKS